MTLVMLDGFDHFTSDEVSRKGWNGAPFGMPPGRVIIPGFVNQSMEVILNNQIFKATPVVDEFVVGFAFNNESQPPLWGGANIMRMVPASGDSIALGLDDVNVLYASSGATQVRGVTPLNFKVWNYVEIKFSGGTIEVHLNGGAVVPEIPATAVAGGSGFYKIIFEIGSLGSAIRIDDFYLCDLLGDHNNDFLGDVHVDTLYPIEDGFYRDWTPLTGSDHFAMVNEPQLDDDDTYNHDVNAGDKDTFIVQSLPFTSGTVLGTQLNLAVEKEDAGLRQIKGLVREASTDYEGPLTTLNTTYEIWSWLMDVDPATGDPWTATHVNDDEYGIEMIV